ncbi:putative ribonuclease H-like domain-containing protein [Tanacetum coccineum]
MRGHSCKESKQGWLHRDTDKKRALIMMRTSAFLYGEIEEEVYVTQPKGFEDPYFPKHVYKVVKALYGLHQDLELVLMQGEFEMSAMGEMSFFLGLQVKQFPDELAKLPMEAAKGPKLSDESDLQVMYSCIRSMIGSLFKKIFKYLKGQPKLGLWYPNDSPFQLEAYSDSDYAGSHGDRKSTTGGCQFLGRRLISWQCKKQTIVATSSTEAEYVAAASCCAQVLKIHTDDNVADLLTKAFDGPRFEYLVVHIGMVNPSFGNVIEGESILLLVVHSSCCQLGFCCYYFCILPGSYLPAGLILFLLVAIGIMLMVPCSCWWAYFSGWIIYCLIGRCSCFLSVCMVSAVGCLFLLAAYIHAAGVVYAANTSIYAAELFAEYSVRLLDEWLLLAVELYTAGHSKMEVE